MSALLLGGGRIWDGLDDSTAAGDVAIEDGRIVEAGASDSREAMAVDVSGCTVLPGLIEGTPTSRSTARPIGGSCSTTTRRR